MQRNPSPHEIQPRVPYLLFKPNCKWVGVMSNNVIVDQAIVYSEKDIEKFVANYMKETDRD